MYKLSKSFTKCWFPYFYKLFYFQVRGSPVPLNRPTPTPAPDHLLGGHNELAGTSVEWAWGKRVIFLWFSYGQLWPSFVNYSLILFNTKRKVINIILRLRPCRRPLWQSQASWLLAWRLGSILIGLLACWVLLSGFLFASTLCWSVCWLVVPCIFLVFAAASLQPLIYALL